MAKCLFVTGTGTDVGKTYVTALIVKKLKESGLKASYYKAAISGADKDEKGNLWPGDALYVKRTAELNENISQLVSYVYSEAVSPHLAANWNNLPIEMDKIVADFTAAKGDCDFLTMEGSGGIVCPLRWDDAAHFGLADMVKRLNLPVVIVAPAGLGAINSAVLTVEYLSHRNIPIKGVILNNFHAGDPKEEDNRLMIEQMTAVPVVATVPHNGKEILIAAEELAALYE